MPPENPNKIVETMIEEQGSATGTFRIESTGYSGGAESTLVATFKNANFVSYVWYTKYETGDPVIYGKAPGKVNQTTSPNAATSTENGPDRGGSPLRCLNNFFIDGESVNGPLHTADHGGVCGSPTFGRNTHDGSNSATAATCRPKAIPTRAVEKPRAPPSREHTSPPRKSGRSNRRRATKK